MWYNHIEKKVKHVDFTSNTEQKNTRSDYEKKVDLYIRQKNLLDTFLEHHAISKEQYDKSLGDLTEKMGMGEVKKSLELKH